MSISEIFIRRPIATALMTAGLFAFGAVSFTLLPVAALPNVEFPTITVSASFPGASPDVMASTVATPLEDQFTAIPGVSSMTSTSGLGTTSITLQFDLSTSITRDAGYVEQAIQAASALLPKNLPAPPTYRETNPADSPVLIYAVHSDAYPIQELDQYANILLGQSLSRVSGVGQVSIAGQAEPAVQVRLNPDALAAKGLGLAQVSAALTSESALRPTGNLEGRHEEFPLDVNQQLENAAQFRKMIVSYSNGAPVELGDIATVVDGPQNPRTGAWYGTKLSEVLLVFKAPGANTLDVVDRIKAMMPQLEKSIPRSVRVDLVSDRSLSIRASVSDVEFTLVLAMALVVLVIFLFLRKFWATVIPGIVLPVVIVATFGAMYLLGYSIDNLSLMALTIAIGFLVDDAIVMIENIVRHIEEGKPPLEAALDGAGEIGFTILSITLSLAAVFIPVLFMAGVVGLLFREFAMTTILAIFISGYVSLTLTPMMCAKFLMRETGAPQNRFSRWLERGFDAMRDTYDRGLVWALRHEFWMLLVTIGLIGLTVYLYLVIPKGFLPEQDTGIFMGVAQARQDIAFEAMAKIENEYAAILLRDPAVSGVVGFAGATGGNPTENTARMFVQLKPFSERPSVQAVMARLRPQVAKVVGGKFFMQAVPDIRIGARLEQAEYQYTLTDTDTDQLNHYAPILLEKMKGMKILSDVASDQQINSPHVVIEVDRNLASSLNVPISSIDAALDDAFGQAQIATIYNATQQAYVILEVEKKFQSGPEALSSLYVTNATGGQVPLSAVARETRKVEPLTVNHQGVFPSVTLSFNLAKGASLSRAVDAITKAKASLGARPTLVGQFEGTAQAFQDSLVTMPLLVTAAIVTIYILMGMLYESFIHPITILSALPAAGVGALVILILTGYDLTLIALIGVLLLIGIVKKNAIMMIDFALVAEREGNMTPVDAVHHACLQRFRPIMMTTVCALIVALPLALENGAGAELRKPMGIAMVGGLLVSQLLTLYTTPVVYIYLDRLNGWLTRARPLAWLGMKSRPLSQTRS
ncbi:HAE1 family hydrophobic/amphiphilic exporter-1/multidrug efflux pump [Roseiarcus fermentans]|uniref:HAE1 family hydrophobic/amphiphilic exporter-1/multidrug efflux pump n=1 Tax=Roseiarcus fermentans TaxID=1473586 RepID=A0A366F5L1_9HYPH|nr:efflux RND transporter permease subunit [Roseiarcus fermentans]RBP09914.1 HAE1 family hydrophobic/amphiphilic exporter-1/multidrug efflux pump [Roseiarcus fermentans]